ERGPRKLGVEEGSDGRAVGAWICPSKHRLPGGRAILRVGHRLLYGRWPMVVLSAAGPLLPERHEQHAIVVRCRYAAAIAIGSENDEFAARYLEDVAEPPVLVREELLLEEDGAPIRTEHHAVEMLTA